VLLALRGVGVMATTAAEFLLNFAEALYRAKSRLAICDEFVDVDIARAKLALDLYRKSDTFKLKAIMEEWSWERIVEELY
jgi:hypothetical protein